MLRPWQVDPLLAGYVHITILPLIEIECILVVNYNYEEKLVFPESTGIGFQGAQN